MKKKQTQEDLAKDLLKSKAIEELKAKGIELEDGDAISGGFIETGSTSFVEVVPTNPGGPGPKEY